MDYKGLKGVEYGNLVTLNLWKEVRTSAPSRPFRSSVL